MRVLSALVILMVLEEIQTLENTNLVSDLYEFPHFSTRYI